MDEVADMLQDVAVDLNENKLNARHSSQQQQELARRYSSKRFNLVNEKKSQPQQQPSSSIINQQTLPRQSSTTSSTTTEKNSISNPFETINQERLNPSRVEAIQHMFEGANPQGKIHY